MKEKIKKIIIESAESCLEGFDISNLEFNVEISKGKDFGDFSTNLAMIYANRMKRSPQDVANFLTESLRRKKIFSKVAVAGPGFINLSLDFRFVNSFVSETLEKGSAYGSTKREAPLKVILEYVSANPTGPIHVGHGRGAVIGSSLANILAFQNYDIQTEYYINDSGRQMDILALSVIHKFNDRKNNTTSKIEGTYKGSYVDQILDEYIKKYNFDNSFKSNIQLIDSNYDDNDKLLTKLIEESKENLGKEFDRIKNFCCSFMMSQIQTVLKKLRVNFNNFYSEKSLYHDGLVQKSIKKLESKGDTYKKDGAVWFASSKYNDEKDRVLVRADGSPTYFASDVAYHEIKFTRKNDILINIWGADHHGYITRLKGAISSLGLDPLRLEVLLVQFASLVMGKLKVSMSTRKGLFKTLDDLIDEVGADATRFFYLMSKADQSLDFDIELAKEESSKNPVYYIQYAHARLCSVIRQSGFEKVSGPVSDQADIYDESERSLIFQIGNFPEVIKSAETNRDPSIVAQYLREFANLVHHNYVINKILVGDAEVRIARLQLANASKHVLANGLKLLGISSPEQM